jgi:hypothetical protein
MAWRVRTYGGRHGMDSGTSLNCRVVLLMMKGGTVFAGRTRSAGGWSCWDIGLCLMLWRDTKVLRLTDVVVGIRVRRYM